MTNNNSTKRIIAYFIDIMLVFFIANLLTMIIPKSEKYDTLNKEFTGLLEKYEKKEITMEEYLDKGNNISYELNKEGVAETIVTTVLTTIYFVVVAYYMNGQTVGKKIMKIKIVANNQNKNLNMNNYLLRAFVINSILLNALSIITILILKKDAYLQVYNIISYFFSILILVSLIMMMFRKDGRGLQDIIANTKVVLVNDKVNEDISEAEIVKEEIKVEDNTQNEVKSEENIQKEKVNKKNITKNKKSKKDK